MSKIYVWAASDMGDGLFNKYPILKDKIKMAKDNDYYCEDTNVYEFAEYIIENVWNRVVIEKVDKENCREYMKPYDYKLVIYDDYIE